ncbi:hypothetical protein NDN08_003103 [Rhodosorus marinus]|uniref:Uncharacterized protein n=1 Tax=Rhodosorus marinus TaxID=101924 RepID=A0AAV8UVX4_9RHOD|nr:hypothetical protein NDN08_003103 [Rhodosorus marinus]
MGTTLLGNDIVWIQDQFWDIGTYLGPDPGFADRIRDHARGHGSEVAIISSKTDHYAVFKCATRRRGGDQKHIPKHTKRVTECPFYIRAIMLKKSSLTGLDTFPGYRRKLLLEKMFGGRIPTSGGFMEGWYVAAGNPRHVGHYMKQFPRGPTPSRVHERMKGKPLEREKAKVSKKNSSEKAVKGKARMQRTAAAKPADNTDAENIGARISRLYLRASAQDRKAIVLAVEQLEANLSWKPSDDVSVVNAGALSSMVGKQIFFPQVVGQQGFYAQQGVQQGQAFFGQQGLVNPMAGRQGMFEPQLGQQVPGNHLTAQQGSPNHVAGEQHLAATGAHQGASNASASVEEQGPVDADADQKGAQASISGPSRR